MSNRRTLLLVPVAASALVLASTASALTSSNLSSPGTGCDTSRPATAWYGDGQRASDQSQAPVPCVVSVGMRSQESSLVVSKSGAIWVSPAENSNAVVGLAKSSDRGQRWQFVDAAPPGPHTGTPLDNCFCDPALYVDPTTNRIFFFSEDTFYCGGNLNYSDDDGRSWNRTERFGCPATQDYDTFVTAPPVTSKTTGYPNILYFCSQGPLIAAGPTRECVKSLDGGLTSAPVGSSGGSGLLPAPNLPSCSQYPLHQGHSMAAGSDGSIYLPVSFCSDAAVAISRDEGDTWKYVQVGAADGGSLGNTSIAADRAGNLFLVWLDGNRRIWLAHSSDRGVHWSKPVSVAPAGVYGESKVAVAASGRGHVAVAYYGTRSTTPGGASSGYITETFNGLAEKPTYWSAAVNNPKHPLCEAYDASGMWKLCNTAANNFANRIDYIGIAFGSDGTPWAAFIAECSYLHNCAQQANASPTEGTDTAVVGSLQVPTSG
jgi:hypothetical protein